MTLYEYAARTVRVVDGDTLIVDLDLGMHTWKHNERLRLYGLDAPEAGTDAGRAATDYLRGLLPDGAEVTVRTIKDRGDKYGRWLAEVSAPGTGWPTVNGALIGTGHAVPWSGRGTRPGSAA